MNDRFFIMPELGEPINGGGIDLGEGSTGFVIQVRKVGPDLYAHDLGGGLTVYTDGEGHILG